MAHGLANRAPHLFIPPKIPPWSEQTVRLLTSALFLGKVPFMLTIRLQRVGRRNNPAFRVVVTNSQNGPKAHYLEMVGSYEPKSGSITLNAERITHWIGVGAQTSDTVHNMLVSKGIISGKKINVLPRKTPPAVASTASESAPASSEVTA